VDRFFSKLDLRDIKIDPFKTSFPPDADDEQPREEVQSASEVDTVARDESEFVPASDQAAPAPVDDQEERRPHAPAWAAAPASVPAPSPAVNNGYVATSTVVETVVTETIVEDEPVEATVAHDGPSSEVLKVSARSRPSAVAGAIAGVVRESGRAEVQAIGAGATNQAVKAVAIARDYLRETGIEAICLPAFIDVTIENEDRTAIRLVVEPR
jgi:stage V sporulation protein SpoVS